MKCCTGKELEGRGCKILQGHMPKFVWSDWDKPRHLHTK